MTVAKKVAAGSKLFEDLEGVGVWKSGEREGKVSCCAASFKHWTKGTTHPKHELFFSCPFQAARHARCAL